METVLEMKTETVTKREVLSKLAKVYDPLGMVGPVTVTAKLIFQDICRENKDWDETVSPEIEMRWRNWMQVISKMTEIKIPRCIMPVSSKARKMSLHVLVMLARLLTAQLYTLYGIMKACRSHTLSLPRQDYLQ